MAKRRRQYHGIHAPVAGLKYDLGSTVISERHTPDCSNVRLTDGYISKPTGTSYFGATGTTPLKGEVMHVDVYDKAGSTGKLLTFTTDHAYQYNTASGRFENLTEGVVVEDCEDAWTASANVTATADTTIKWRGTYSSKLVIDAAFTTGVAAYEDFSLADLSGYTALHFLIYSTVATSAGDLQVLLDDTSACASPLETLDVPALTANTWTMCSVAFVTPANLTAVISVGLNVATDLGAQTVYLDDIRAVVIDTGDEDDVYSSVVLPDGSSPPVDIITWTNGVDTVKKWDLVTDTAEDLANATSYIPKWMLWFGQRLCMYNMLESAVRYRVRCRWPVAGDPEDWSGTGSGAEDLRTQLDVGDEIRRAEKLGDYAIIYGKKSMALQEHRTGNVSQPFFFYPRISNVGLAAPRALVNLYGHEHIFMSFVNVHSFKGGRDASMIGDSIVDELFDIINPLYIQRSFMTLDEYNNIVRLYIPTGNSVRPNEYFELDLGTRAWSRGTGTLSGHGWYEHVGGETWDSISGTWQAQTATWDDLSVITVQPKPVWGDNSGYVYQGDEQTYDRAGVAIDAWWDTKDFTAGEDYKRESTSWMEFGFDAKGDALDLYYSVDEGVSYTALPIGGSNTITLSSDWDRYEAHMEVWGPQIRFRFRNDTSEETFAVRHIEVGYIEKSDVETSED